MFMILILHGWESYSVSRPFSVCCSVVLLVEMCAHYTHLILSAPIFMAIKSKEEEENKKKRERGEEKLSLTVQEPSLLERHYGGWH